MQQDIDKVLIDRHKIADRVRKIARAIARDVAAATSPEADLSGRGPAGITIVPILTGSLIFVADLIRHMPLRMRIHLVSIGSYPGRATVSRGAQLRKDLTNLPESLTGAHVLLVDDILDSGNTLRLAADILGEHQPASVRTCVLLRKKRPQALAYPVDYVCFDIPDKFVVGYGLDYNDYYRNLPDIVTLKPQVTRQDLPDASAAVR